MLNFTTPVVFQQAFCVINHFYSTNKKRAIMAIPPICTDEPLGFIKKLLLSPVESSPSLPALGGLRWQPPAALPLF